MINTIFRKEEYEKYKNLANSIQFQGKEVRHMDRAELIIFLGWLVYDHDIKIFHEREEWEDTFRKEI